MLKLAETTIESVTEIMPKTKKSVITDDTIERPDKVEAIIYKMESNFVRHKVYITLGYIIENDNPRPVEIFINSKDLSKSPEYTVLTRLISAIFRKTPNPVFILEELGSINDPNGGYHKNGKYIHSFYSEVALVIEQFFKEIGLIKPSESKQDLVMSVSTNQEEHIEQETKFQICPECGQKTVKMENGCLSCVNPECTFSKCDH